MDLGGAPWPRRPPSLDEQSVCYLHDLGVPMALPSTRGAPDVHFTYEKPILLVRRRDRPARHGRAAALSPARGAHVRRERRSRLDAVLMLLTYVVVSTILGRQN